MLFLWVFPIIQEDNGKGSFFISLHTALLKGGHEQNQRIKKK